MATQEYSYNVYRKNYNTDRLIDGPSRPSNPYPIKAVPAVRADLAPSAYSNKLYNYVPYQPTTKTVTYETPDIDMDYANYDDKTQVNSVADIIARTVSKDLEAFRKGRLAFSGVDAIKDTFNLLNDYTVKPLLHGNFKALGLNLLVNLGETMDYVTGASAIKAGIQDGWSGVKDTLLSDENGRTNYDINTGNVFEDMLGEMIVDPTNWVTLGGWGVAKSAAKDMATGLKTVANVGDAVDDVVYKKVAKKAVSSYMKGDYSTMDTAMRSITEDFAKRGRIGLKRVPKTEDFLSAMDNLVKTSTIYKSNDVLDAVQKLVKPVEGLQDLATKAVGSSTGIYPVFKAVGAGISWAKTAQVNRIQNALEPHLLEDGNINPFKFEDALKDYSDIVKIENAVPSDLSSKADFNDFTRMFTDSVNANTANVQKLLQDYKGYDDFNTKLVEWFGLNPEDDALDAYIKKLKEVNAVTGDMYQDVERYITDIKNSLDSVRNVENKKAIIKSTSTQLRAMNIIQEDFSKHIYSTSEPITNISDLMQRGNDFAEAAVDIDKTFSLEDELKDTYTYLENRINTHKDSLLKGIENTSKYYDADFIIEEVRSVVDNFLEELNDTYKDKWFDERIYNTNYPMYMQYVDKLKTILIHFKMNIDNQLDTSFKKSLQQSLDIGRGTIKLPKLDLDKTQVLKRLNALTQQAQQAVTKLQYGLDSKSLGKTYKSLTDLISKADGVQDKFVDEIFKSGEKYTRHLQQTKTISDGTNAYSIKRIQKQITDGLGKNTPSDVALRISQEGGGSAYVISEALDGILNSTKNGTFLDIQEYVSAHDRLQRVLYEASNKLRYRATFPGDISGVKPTQDTISFVENTLELLQKNNPYRVIDGELSMSVPGIYRTRKLEQSYTSLKLASLPINNALLSDTAQNTGRAGRAIRDLAERYKDATDPIQANVGRMAQDIIAQGNHTRTYNNFINNLMQSVVDEKVKVAFFSTIQKWANKTPIDVVDNMDWIFNQIIDQTEQHIYGTNIKTSLTLENLLDKDSGKLRDILDSMPGIDNKLQHTALYDTVGVEVVVDNLLAKEFDSQGAVAQVFYDIESTGLTSANSSAFEIAWKNRGGEGYQLNRKLVNDASPFNQPTDTALEKFYPNTDPMFAKMTLPEKREYFFKHRSGDLTEKELYMNFIEGLKDTARKHLGKDTNNPYELAKGIELIGQNTSKFDDKYVAQRLAACGIPIEDRIFFSNINKKDILPILQKDNGFTPVSQKDKAILRRLFEQYAISQSSNDILKLIAPSPGKLSDDYRRIADYYYYHGDLTDETTRAIVDELKAAASEVSETLQDIKQNNYLLKNDILTPEAFDNGTYLDAFKRLVKGLNLSEEDAKALLDSDYINSTKLTYGPFQDTVHKYGVKNAIDTSVMKEWFKVSDEAVVPVRLAKAFTSLGHSFDKIRSGIKNPNLLIEYATEIKQALKTLMPSEKYGLLIQDVLNGGEQILDPTNPLQSFYYHLRTDKADVLSDFVTLQYVYKTYKNKGYLTDVVKSQLSADVLDLLENSKEVFKVPFSEIPYNKLIDNGLPSLSNARAWNVISKNFKENVVDGIKNLGNTLDDNDLFSSKAQVISNMLMPVAEISEELSKVPDGLRGKLHELSKTHMDNLATASTVQVLSLKPKDLAGLMANDAPFIKLSMDDLLQEGPITKAYLNLKSNLKELNELNIDLKELDDSVYIYLTKDFDLSNEYVRPNLLPVRSLETIDVDRLTPLFKNIETAMDSLDRMSEGKSIGSLGDHVSAQFFQDIYKDIPNEIKNNMLSIDDITDTKLFDGQRYNFSILGSLAGRKMTQLTLPSNMASVVMQQAEHSARMAKTKLQYAQLYYGKAFSINTGILSKSTDKEIVKTLKENPQLVLTALVKDDKLGYKAVKINTKAKDGLADARRLNAVIMPYQTFMTAQEVINKNHMTSAKAKFWNKIIYSSKVGMLLSPGVVMRNMADSTMKNMIETETFFKTIKGMFEARKAIRTYDKVVNDVLNLSQYDLKLITELGLDPKKVIDTSLNLKYSKNIICAQELLSKYTDMVDDIMKLDSNRMFTDKNLKYYFNNMHPELDLETFLFVDRFIKDGPSAGLTKNWQKHYADLYSDPNVTKDMWDTFTHVTNKLMEPNANVEQTARLAEYMILAEKGYNNTEAFYKIAKTHFDYSDKSKFARTIENVIPFYNFTMKNLEYWANAIEEHPWFMNLFTNIYTPVWNFDDYDQKEYTRNQSLQYQILSGNLPLTDSGMTLKLSPSFMDVLNIVTNPLDAAESKVLPLFKIPSQAISQAEQTGSTYKYYDKEAQTWKTGVREGKPLSTIIMQSLPIVGPTIQRLGETGEKYYERTGNPLNRILPSMFGATKRWEEIPKKAKKSTYSRKPRVYTRPRKTKVFNKGYGYNAYYKKSYARPYYPTRSYTPSKYRPFGLPDTPIRGRTVTPNYYVNFKADSFYKKHYSKNGNSKFKMRMTKVTPQTLRYKIRDSIRYAR